MTKAVYKFYKDYGRSGDLSGVFVADTDMVKKAMGKSVYMDDVLGKHSDIHFYLDEDNLECVTDDPKVIELFEEHDLASGYNPLDYMDFDDTDDEETDEE